MGTETTSTTISNTTTSTSPPSTNTTTMTTSTSGSTSTTTISTTSSSSTTEVMPDPGPDSSRGHFDGWSFFGGILLTLGIAAIGFVGFKYYKLRNVSSGGNYNRF